MRTTAPRQKKPASSLHPTESMWLSDRLWPEHNPSPTNAKFDHSYAELAIFSPDTTPRDLEPDQSVTDQDEHESDANLTALPESVESVLNTSGMPLQSDARAKLEARFNTSFAEVRLHSDEAAMQSAAEVGARAYTVGSHIVLPVEPSSPESSSLLAHELTHVVQQRGGGVIPELSKDAAHEREAEQIGNTVTSGTAQVRVATQTAVGLARNTNDGPSEPPPPVHKEILKELNRQLDAQKKRAVQLLDEEGIETKTRDKAHQPHNTDFLKRQLKRVADDPGSPRQKAAQALIGEIDQTKEALRNVNRDHPNHREAPLERDKPGSSARNPNKKDSAKDAKQTPTKTQFDAKPQTPKPANAPTQSEPSSKTKLPSGSSQVKQPKPTGATSVSSSSSPVAADPAKKQAFSTALASHLATSSKSAARFDRFFKGLSTFLSAKGALDHALEVLGAIKNMTSLLAHGTALPAEQRQADQVLRQSTEASNWAGSAMDDVPVFSWIPLIDSASRLEDTQSLFAIDEHLTQLGSPLEKSQLTFQDLAQELAQNAAELKGAQFKQLIEIAMPHTDGTASNATAFALHQSLGKLHSAILSASNNYAAAAAALSGYVAALQSLSNSANSAGWDAAQLQARRRYEREHGKP